MRLTRCAFLALSLMCGTVLLPSPALATVTATATSVEYAGNGATTAFATTFKFLDNSHLVVTTTTAGITTTKTITTHYTVAGAGASTGTVTMLAAPAVGTTLTITRELPLTQLTSLRSQGSFSPAVYENALDRAVMLLQQLNAELDAVADGELNTDGDIEIGGTLDVAGVATFSAGSISTSAAVNGNGAAGNGAGTGSGFYGSGGLTGPGVTGWGGAGGAPGGDFFAGGTNADGVKGAAEGTGAGVYGLGGDNSGPGVSGLGGNNNGIGVKGVGAGTGAGGSFTSTAGYGVIATSANGDGIDANGGTNGNGITSTGAGSGYGGEFQSTGAAVLNLVQNGSTHGHLRFTLLSPAPTAPVLGEIYVDTSAVVWICTNATGPVWTRVSGGGLAVDVPSTFTIPSDGTGGTGTGTLTPTTSYIKSVCNDPENCIATMGEVGVADGTIVRISHTSANTTQFSDNAGIQNISVLGAYSMGAGDELCLKYVVDVWNECGRSDN